MEEAGRVFRLLTGPPRKSDPVLVLTSLLFVVPAAVAAWRGRPALAAAFAALAVSSTMQHGRLSQHSLLRWVDRTYATLVAAYVVGAGAAERSAPGLIAASFMLAAIAMYVHSLRRAAAGDHDAGEHLHAVMHCTAALSMLALAAR